MTGFAAEMERELGQPLKISPAVQSKRDEKKLEILQWERKNATNPEDIKALDKEIGFASRQPRTQAQQQSIMSQMESELTPTVARLPNQIPEPQPATAQQPQAAQPEKTKPALGMNPVQEATVSIASGMGGAVAGGLYGLYKLATTGNLEQASEAVKGTQEKLTYQPVSAGAQKAVEVAGSGYNPLNWPSIASKKAAEIGQDIGLFSPEVATAVEVVGTMAPFGLAAKALKGGAKPLPNKGAFQSAGAAAATTAQTARTVAAAATPELGQAITKIPEKFRNMPAITRQAEADSLPIPIKLTQGEATGNSGILSLERNRRGTNAETRQRLEDTNNNLKENLNVIRDEAAPDVHGVNHVENGQSLIDAYKATDDSITKDISAKYKALEQANGGKFPVDGVAFADAAEAALGKKLKTDFVPPPIAKQLTQFKEGKPMTFEDFEAMRTNLAAEMRKAERSGDGNAAMAAGIVRDALESLPMTGDAAALKPLADAARQAARARFQLLEKDPAYKAAVHDKVSADDFINKFVVKGKAADVKQMVQHLGKGSQAHQTMAAGALNYLKQQAGIVNEAGNFSQAGYNKALQSLSPKLRDILDPKAAQHVETLGKVARYTQEQTRGSFVNNSNTLVGAMAEGAKSGMEGMANVAAHGVPVGTVTRRFFKGRAERKQIQRSLQTGAGMDLRDLK